MTWPLQPLLDLPNITARDVRSAANLGRHLWNRARTEGLTDWQADRAAIRLGHHPANIWPTWIQAELTPLDHIWLHEGWRTAWLWNEAA